MRSHGKPIKPREHSRRERRQGATTNQAPAKQEQAKRIEKNFTAG
jgi:hypothetical protein